MNKSGILFIISGPAGVGKTTVVNTLLSHVSSKKLQRLVTTTTRQPRENEINGVHYFFVTKEEFLNKIENHEFLEYAIVHGSTYYGSSKETLIKNLSQGINSILVIDVQGFQKISEQNLNIPIVSIFIKPNELDILRERLLSRGTETLPEIKNRLNTAKSELQFANQYKYIINSGTREEDFQKLLNIYNKETGLI